MDQIMDDPNDIIILTLTDGVRNNIIAVHKSVLAKNSPFFERLFTMFKEKNQDKITVEVSNIYVTSDIIMGFYDQKSILENNFEWQYRLELVKCYDYLGIPCDASFVENINIPPESFDLLLNAIDIIGYNDATIKVINKYLPKNYDTSKFPKALIDEMTRINVSYRVAACGMTNTYQSSGIIIWDPVNGGIVQQLPESLDDTKNKIKDKIFCIAYSPNNQYIASGSYNGNIKIWNLLTGTLTKILSQPLDIYHIGCICFCPDNQKIAIGHGYNSLSVWDISSEKIIQKLIGHVQTVESICYSSDAKRIVSGSRDKTIKIWDATNGNLLSTLTSPLGPNNWVFCVCYSPNNQQIVSCDDKKITIWNAATENIIRTLHGHTEYVVDASYSPDGQRIISSSHDKTIKIWDALTGNLMQTLDGHNNYISFARYSSDNQIIVSSSWDKTIKTWDAFTGNLINTLHLHYNPVNVALTIDPNNDLIERLLKN